MITNVLHISQIKKDPTCLIGLARPAIITKYGLVVAYVVPQERMEELLKIEEQAKCHHTFIGKSENQRCSKCGKE